MRIIFRILSAGYGYRYICQILFLNMDILVSCIRIRKYLVVALVPSFATRTWNIMLPGWQQWAYNRNPLISENKKLFLVYFLVQYQSYSLISSHGSNYTSSFMFMNLKSNTSCILLSILSRENLVKIEIRLHVKCRQQILFCVSSASLGWPF